MKRQFVPSMAASPFLVGLTLLGAGLAGAACSGDDGEDQATTGGNYGEEDAVSLNELQATIVLDDTSFSPRAVRVEVGTTVTWVNQDEILHNVASIDNLFRDDELRNGDTYSFRFDEPGTYRYQCTFHHPNMNGAIIVEA